ncbi:MAG: hypothetical protein V3575_00715 [Candidatus Absconditabacteria bacterium]
MKKTLFLIIPILLTIGGCGNQNIDENKPIENTNQEEGINDLVQELNQELGNVESDGKTTKQDCMAGCEIMWKSSPLNSDKSSDEMEKECNSLCDASQGMENNDISQCEKAEGMMRDSCFTDIAQDLNQPEICGKISEPMLRNGCYTSIAEENKDISICNNITDKMWNGICKENVNNPEEELK